MFKRKTALMFSLILIALSMSSCAFFLDVYHDMYYAFKNMKRNPYIRVEFNSWFLNDTVTFIFNSQIIFKDEVLRSNWETGGSCTSYDFLFLLKKGEIIVQSHYDTIVEQKIQTKTIEFFKKKDIHFITIVNGKTQQFRMDASKARNIWFDKVGDSLMINQTCRPMVQE